MRTGGIPVLIPDDIHTIEDFFNETKNPNGILPPIVLFILSFRINPTINTSSPTTAMSNHRQNILNNVHTLLNVCCQCGTQNECKESKVAQFFAKKALGNICPNVCVNQSTRTTNINWNTFDPIFNFLTHTLSSGVNILEETIGTILFEHITPISTFVPVNINSYIESVVYKNKKNNFKEKITFYEDNIYQAYKENPIYNEKGPLDVPKEVLEDIQRAWKSNKTPHTGVFTQFKNKFHNRNYHDANEGPDPVEEVEEFYDAAEEINQ
jgi:hypothetical protein